MVATQDRAAWLAPPTLPGRGSQSGAISRRSAINETVGALAVLPEQFEGISSTVDRVASTLENHGVSLSDMKERIDRIDERGSRMASEIHDERTARESAQRLIDSHAHDTHRSIYERIEALESRFNA